MLLSLNLEPAPGENARTPIFHQERDTRFGSPKLIRRSEEADFGLRRMKVIQTRRPPFYFPFLVILSLNVFVISGVLMFCALLMLS